MVLCNCRDVLQVNPRRHRKVPPLPVFQARHSTICSGPECIFCFHRQSHGRGAVEVQFAVLAINSIDPDRCRSPDCSVRPRGECIHTVVCQSLAPGDRKSTRLNSSHVEISYAVFCLKKKKKKKILYQIKKKKKKNKITKK